MNLRHLNLQLPQVLCCLLASLLPAELFTARPVSAEKIYNFDDQYVQIEARTVASESRSAFGVEIGLTPKPGWKLLASNSSSIKPLRLKVAPGKCLQLKGTVQQSVPDWSGTDDSGAFSEYFTKSATIRQELLQRKCTDKKGLAGSASLSYLLCQDNRCVGPFSREIKFTAPAQK